MCSWVRAGHVRNKCKTRAHSIRIRIATAAAAANRFVKWFKRPLPSFNYSPINSIRMCFQVLQFCCSVLRCVRCSHNAAHKTHNLQLMRERNLTARFGFDLTHAHHKHRCCYMFRLRVCFANHAAVHRSLSALEFWLQLSA